MIRDLIVKNRSYRRFYEEEKIDMEILKGLVDLARLSGSGQNLQNLKYKLINDPKQSEALFPYLAWAGYLKEWKGPEEGERPAAYIIILKDTSIGKGLDCDLGIASQSILLGATEKGFGGCMLGAIQREEIRKTFNIPAIYEIPLVIALGKPKEEVILEEVGAAGDIKYWRDAEGKHHVPKRKLEDILL